MSPLYPTLLVASINSILGAPSIELIEATNKVGYKGDTTYIPNGVDPRRFSPDGPDLRDDLNIGANEFVVLVARRLVPKNGVLDFAQSTS